jgi:hypothetical protein
MSNQPANIEILEYRQAERRRFAGELGQLIERRQQEIDNLRGIPQTNHDNVIDIRSRRR